MTAAGWIFMISSVGFVVALFAYCSYRVLTAPPEDREHMHGPLDIDTHDKDT